MSKAVKVDCPAFKCFQEQRRSSLNVINVSEMFVPVSTVCPRTPGGAAICVGDPEAEPQNGYLISAHVFLFTSLLLCFAFMTLLIRCIVYILVILEYKEITKRVREQYIFS